MFFFLYVYFEFGPEFFRDCRHRCFENSYIFQNDSKHLKLASSNWYHGKSEMHH